MRECVERGVKAYRASLITLYACSKCQFRLDIKYAAIKAAERDFPPKQCIKVPPFSTPASMNMFDVGMHERIFESPLRGIGLFACSHKMFLKVLIYLLVSNLNRQVRELLRKRDG